MEIMPWLDKISILQHGKIIQQDIPKNIYQNPTNQYVAQLLGEVNRFTDLEKKEFNLIKNFYFPEEIQCISDGFLAEVLESRFAGSKFWNKIRCKNKEIIMYTTEPISGYISIRIGKNN